MKTLGILLLEVLLCWIEHNGGINLMTEIPYKVTYINDVRHRNGRGFLIRTRSNAVIWFFEENVSKGKLIIGYHNDPYKIALESNCSVVGKTLGKPIVSINGFSRLSVDWYVDKIEVSSEGDVQSNIIAVFPINQPFNISYLGFGSYGGNRAYWIFEAQPPTIKATIFMKMKNIRTTPITMTRFVDSVIQCSVECNRINSCYGFNYSPYETTNNCELVAQLTDGFQCRIPWNLTMEQTADTSFDYYHI